MPNCMKSEIEKSDFIYEESEKNSMISLCSMNSIILDSKPRSNQGDIEDYPFDPDEK